MDVERTFRQFDRMGQRVGAPVTARAPTIPTEQGAVLFGILNGVATSVAQLIAGGRLSTLDTDTISARDIALPVAVGATGLMVATRFVPSG